MPPLTGKTPGNGTGTLSYTIPGAGLDVESVYVSVDASGAAGAVTAELTITDQSGVVIARKVQNTTIDQGVAGSATWALQLDDDCLTAPVNPTFPALVLTIGGAGTLRGYWRLGEVASPFADTSGWSGGPSPANVVASGTPYTTHVAGALPPAEDDGALQFNAPVSGGYYIGAGNSNMWTGVQTSFTAMAWINPIASASNWVGGVLANETVVAGAPSHEEGWYLSAQWDLGVIYARMFRVVNNVRQATIATIPAATWTFVVGTYDGTTSRLYVNGSLASTNADARGQYTDALSGPTIGRLNLNPGPVEREFYGVIDEVAFWGTVLTPSNIASLYAAALP